VTDQSSVLRFIEDNFGLGRVDSAPGIPVADGGSFDQIAGSIGNLFDFDGERGERQGRDDRRLILSPSTGQPAHW
jgi:phospholipase C